MTEEASFLCTIDPRASAGLIGREYRANIIVVTGYDTAYSKMAKMIGNEGGVRTIETFTKPVRLDDLRKSLQ